MHDALLIRSAAGNGLFLPGVITCIGLALFSPNPTLTTVSILLAWVLCKLLWRPGEPPVLLYTMGFQWLQASILVFYADLQNLPMKELATRNLEGDNSMIIEATWLTLMGVLVIALGSRLATLSNFKLEAQPKMVPNLAPLQVRRLFHASLWAIALSNALGGLGYLVTGLAEPIRGLLLVHWVIYYLLAYTAFAEQRGYRELTMVFAVELAIGFLGFFSDFKTVLIMTLMAALAAPNALRGNRLRNVVAIVAITATLGVVWSSIKTDYRNFLNRGTVGQVILVSPGEQVLELITLIGELTPQKLNEGAEGLIYRISFVDFFSGAIGMVPGSIAYEDGKLWLEAIQHVLMPRLFFPSKPVINDSDRTTEYSGITVARGEEGSSIGMGYIAETYIDFGPAGMMLPLFLWGLAVGWAYRILTRSARYPPFAYGCAAALISLNASWVEQSNIKMLGSVIVGFLALYLIQKYLAEKLLRLLVAPVSN